MRFILPQPQTRTVTIANSATVSDAEATGIQGVTILGLITPSGLTGTALTFQVSMDNATFFALNDPDTGTAVTIVAAASKAYALDPALMLAWGYVKVVSGSTETGGDVITIIVRQWS